MSAATNGGCGRVEQAVGFALHVLEPDEEATVLAHLPGCAECRAAVRDTEEIVGMVGGAVEPVEPPDRLRATLLDAVARTPQEPGVERPRARGTDSGAGAGAAGGGAAGARPGGTRPAPGGPSGTGPGRPAGARFRRRIVAAALAVVALAAIGGLAARVVQLQDQTSAQAVQTQTLVAMVAQFDQPGTRHAWLAPEPGGTPVAAVMVHGATQQYMAVGLPGNDPAADTYVLWGTGAGAPRPLGTFDVRSGQSGPHAVDSGGEAGGYAGYAISLEPGRAAPASPSTVVAIGQVEL